MTTEYFGYPVKHKRDNEETKKDKTSARKLLTRLFRDAAPRTAQWETLSLFTNGYIFSDYKAVLLRSYGCRDYLNAQLAGYDLIGAHNRHTASVINLRRPLLRRELRWLKKTLREINKDSSDIRYYGAENYSERDKQHSLGIGAVLKEDLTLNKHGTYDLFDATNKVVRQLLTMTCIHTNSAATVNSGRLMAPIVAIGRYTTQESMPVRGHTPPKEGEVVNITPKLLTSRLASACTFEDGDDLYMKYCQYIASYVKDFKSSDRSLSNYLGQWKPKKKKVILKKVPVTH